MGAPGTTSCIDVVECEAALYGFEYPCKAFEMFRRCEVSQIGCRDCAFPTPFPFSQSPTMEIGDFCFYLNIAPICTFGCMRAADVVSYLYTVECR